MKKSVHSKSFTNKYLLLMTAGILLAFTSVAQTYTTRADGSWTSPATWVGGQVPNRTIGSGMVVNIIHDVTCNVNGDLSISGVLNIIGDTLRFNSSFDKKTIVNPGGLLYVKDGGYIQYMPSKKNDLEIHNGRLYVESSKFNVSKRLSADDGSKINQKNSYIQIGENYEPKGNGGSKVYDTIQNSTIEVLSGDFHIDNHSILKVANVTLKVNNGDAKFESNADVIVLPNATGNFGFDAIKIKNDMENKGDWDARVDAFCIDGDIKGNKMGDIDFIRPEDCTLQPASTPAPELSFTNPVLISGQANKQNAVYRFSNVYPGVDATVKLVKFSRNDIVMKSFDKADMGWGKALQPEFGLPGLVQKNQNWYIDFELNFYEAGTNTKKLVKKVDMTALDVDGDGNSILEYAIFQNPTSVIYSTVSYLSSDVNINPAGSLFCPIDGLLSPLLTCIVCGGDGKSGLWNWTDCALCDGTGQLFSLCNHPYEGTNGNSLQGPIDNFVNIDTAATQVMATYQYFNTDKIKFRYGAKSGNKTSNGSGIRLNSLWFRQFSLAPAKSLPVKLTNFNAVYDKKDVVLGWTGHEENFSHYVVQRSTDGKEFKDIAIVFATGGPDATNSYKYKDAGVSSNTGMVFYRLQLFDKTAEAANFSEIKAIRLNKLQETLQLATYPNPVTDQLRVTLPAAWQGKVVTIELFNANGTKVQSKQLGNASQTETMLLAKESKGFYIVKATCNGEVAQQRIVKN
jgi:hypothetical protein